MPKRTGGQGGPKGLAARPGPLGSSPYDILVKWAIQRGWARPELTLLSSEGPSHRRIFTVQATFHHWTHLGQGTSIKRAKHQAARALIAQLSSSDFPGSDPPPPPPAVGSESAPHLGGWPDEVPSTPAESGPSDQSPPVIPGLMDVLQALPGPGPSVPLTDCDELVLDKVRRIGASSGFIHRLTAMVGRVERALMATAWHWAHDPVYCLLGATRVGRLAQGSLLATDGAVHLVVMAQVRPSYRFLQDLRQELARLLATGPPQRHYQCHLVPERSRICVALGRSADPVNLNITVTSHQWKQLASDPDPLPTGARDSGLWALTEIRRYRWFEACLQPAPLGVAIVQILRDWAARHPVMNVLSDWSLELLTERAWYCQMEPLTPSRLLLGVFEALSCPVDLVSLIRVSRNLWMCWVI
ncbi:zinc finger RNA-binding protein-like isoform X2 [Tigriopus californicus]|uniref:zinc finger RNA-binding protein-like isoform X2 n=1 Tax=Tigriopus californicus TaxID=6832 RepID=UPI0027D9EB12|nr:zinc finger RNA-binding protein-like isoform X2 [Tigriopus californicus]